MKIKNRIALAILPPFLVVLCATYWLIDNWLKMERVPGGTILANDPRDAQNMIDGASAHPRLIDTLAWWHGTWINGEASAYYRPLTSQIFWTEYKLFGDHGLMGFTAVHCISHLVVVVLLYYFLSELAGRRMALFATCLYSLEATAVLSLPDIAGALEKWVCDNDIWMAGAQVAALWLYLLYLRKAKFAYLPWAIFAFFISIAFKEMGYTCPLVATLLLWHEERLRQWRSLVPFYAAAVFLYALRWPFLGGPGTRDNTDGSWLMRTLTNDFGISARTYAGDLLPLAVALLGLAAISLIFTAYPRRSLILTALAVAAFCATPILYREPISDTCLRLIGSSLPWVFGFYTGLFLLLAWRTLRVADRTQIFGYLWAFITYSPLMLSAVWTHAWYLPAMGWSLWLAYGLMDLGAMCAARIKSWSVAVPRVSTA